MANIALLLVLLKCLVATVAYTDSECATYDHAKYGCVGKCIPTSSCPGGENLSGLCPTQAYNIKCCFTADSDTKCSNSGGQCISMAQCPGRNYRSNFCPTKSADIKCCFSKPTDTCSDSCPETTKSLACQILRNSKITLLKVNPSGVDDGADAWSNIKDTCDGKKAKRSSYCCSSSRCAPGGSVCVNEKVLRYLLDLADEGHSIKVNAITGACHSNTSRHYRGMAVDLQISYVAGEDWAAWSAKCQESGAVENLNPNNHSGHKTHTHCAFN